MLQRTSGLDMRMAFFSPNWRNLLFLILFELTCPTKVNPMALRIFLFTIAALLSGAHFFRANNYALVFLCLVTPMLFFLKKNWVLMFLQLAAYVATANWLVATVELVQFRQQLGQALEGRGDHSGVRGGVGATLITGVLLNARCMRDRYPASK